MQKTNGEKKSGTDVKEITCIIMICILAQLFPAEGHINFDWETQKFSLFLIKVIVFCLVYVQEYYLKQQYLQKTNGEQKEKSKTDVKEIACILMICILAQLFAAFDVWGAYQFWLRNTQVCIFLLKWYRLLNFYNSNMPS